MRRGTIARLLLILVITVTAVHLAPPKKANAQVTFERQLLAYINQLRRGAGLNDVSMHSALNLAAQRHANDMAARDTLSHTGGDGSNPGQRVTAVRYPWMIVGENCLYRWDMKVWQAFMQWYNSAGHRANMLKPGYVHVGIAYAQSASGRIYVELILAAPKPR